MKSFKIELPADLDEAEIKLAADWHIGDKLCNYKAIADFINYVKDHANCYVLCVGDLINNATKSSVSDSYSEVMNPNEQINMLVKLLTPIKDKILFMTQGNHEARTYKTDGIDITYRVARELGISDRYEADGGLVYIKVGKNQRVTNTTTGVPAKICYSIYCMHGSGGGRKEGAKATRLADMASIVDADIYVHAHTHLPMTMKETFFRSDKSNCSCKNVVKLFVNTAATLNYGGYGQTYEFKPNSIDTPTIYLSGTQMCATARL